jgi:voltage-gated potassium channel
MIAKIRKRVFEILEAPRAGDHTARFVGATLVLIILLNVAAIMLVSVESVRKEWHPWFRAFETFSVAVFTLEYVLRMWVVTGHAAYRRPVLGRLRYAVTPLALIDLAAFLPFYIPRVLPVNMLFVRVLRLLRLMRVMKLGRYSESVRTLAAVIRERKEELAAALLLLVILMVVAASTMYMIEHEAQPDRFTSIPASLWWAVCTLTTIGYGDMYPVTSLGKFLAGVIAIMGIGLFALPAGILGSGFVEKLHERRQPRLCPHCGKDVSKPAEEKHHA